MSNSSARSSGFDRGRAADRGCQGGGSGFDGSHIAQMLGYLNITGLKTALLLNFKYAQLGIKRVSN